MNARKLLSLAIPAASLVFAGCATTQYPMTYQVPLGPAQVTSSYGPPNLVVNGVQDVPARSGSLLYYQVVSPVNVIFYAFDKTGSGPGGPILSQMQGNTFYSSVAPTGDTVEFLFSSTTPVTGGTVQLTVSDTPMAAGTGAVPTASAPMGGSMAQQPVWLSPANINIVTGQTVTFSVSGGTGSGAFVWGGAAAASGYSNAYTFYAPGTYTVTVYHAGDGSYAQSNTASATVIVSPAATAPMGAMPNPAVTVTPVR